MAKPFRYQDNLGNMLSSSPEPFMKISKETSIEGFEDYMQLNIDDYAVYAETSPDTIPKYTMISKIQNMKAEPIKKDEKEEQTDNTETPGPIVQDVIASKMFEQSKMSTINTVYIGSLTIIGLYVLFRYMKY
uniref:Uncharacterized protein n=1 Tax=viral metagenome TaxID=1070528 RepID=A0A6C0K0G9_9ZZZZ